MSSPRETLANEYKVCVPKKTLNGKTLKIQNAYPLQSGRIKLEYELPDSYETTSEIWNPSDNTIVSLKEGDSKDEICFDLSPETQVEQFQQLFPSNHSQQYKKFWGCATFLSSEEVVVVKPPKAIQKNSADKKSSEPLEPKNRKPKEWQIEFYQKEKSDFKKTKSLPREKDFYPVTVTSLSSNKFIVASLSNQFQVWERKDAKSEFKKVNSFNLFKETWPQCKHTNFSDQNHCYIVPENFARNLYVNPKFASIYALNSNHVLYVQTQLSYDPNFQVIQKVDLTNRKLVSKLIINGMYDSPNLLEQPMISFGDGETFLCAAVSRNTVFPAVFDAKNMALYSIPSCFPCTYRVLPLPKLNAIFSISDAELYTFPHIKERIIQEMDLHLIPYLGRNLTSIVTEYSVGVLSSNPATLYGKPWRTPQELPPKFECEDFFDKARHVFDKRFSRS